nr:hypothetical protein [Streptomyces roseifaciens]
MMTFSQRGVQPDGQGLEEVREPGPVSGRDDGIGIRAPIGPPEVDVVTGGEFVALEVLEDHGGRGGQPGRVRERFAVPGQVAARRRVEAGEDLGERGLAGAVLPGQGDDLPAP